eukprot:UN4293
MKWDGDFRKDLYGKVVFSGGRRMFPGLGEGMPKGITVWAPWRMKIKGVAPRGGKYSVGMGGSFFSSFSPFQQMGFWKGG